jgi:hypothetical protein
MKSLGYIVCVGEGDGGWTWAWSGGGVREDGGNDLQWDRVERSDFPGNGMKNFKKATGHKLPTRYKSLDYALKVARRLSPGRVGRVYVGMLFG